MPGRNSQISRIYALLTLMESTPRGLTVNELAQRLNERGHTVGKRTVYRDLEALQGAGFPLISEETGLDSGASSWRLEKITKVTEHFVLNSRELLALYLARGVLTPLRDTPFFADLESIFNKLEMRLGTQSREHLAELAQEMHFEPGPRWGLGLDPDLLETVRACCSEKHVLSVRYTSASQNEERERRLGPQFLYFARGSLYLVAEDLENSTVKVFAVPRMRDAVMLEEPYDSEAVDPARYFQSSFGIYRGDTPVPVKIEFAPAVAPYVRERRWHDSQSVISKSGGSIVLSMDVALTPELVQWVLGFGPNAHVLEPEALVRKITESASEVLKKYRGPKAA